MVGYFVELTAWQGNLMSFPDDGLTATQSEPEVRLCEVRARRRSLARLSPRTPFIDRLQIADHPAAITHRPSVQGCWEEPKRSASGNPNSDDQLHVARCMLHAKAGTKMETPD